jgi:small subunit ribosomal protein S3
MSTVNHFIAEAIHNTEIDEFLAKELERAGFGGVEITRTPLGTRVIIYTTKPGLVIGRRGTNIRELARVLEEKFKLQNPQIAVSEIEVPELNPRVMAQNIADALQRGLHFRRACFWALNQIMRAGAIGVEIVIRGKLTTQRHRYEKYVAGYIPKSGDPAIKNTRIGKAHVLLKQGLIGISVSIIPPNAVFPDRLQFITPETTKEVAAATGGEVSENSTDEIELSDNIDNVDELRK